MEKIFTVAVLVTFLFCLVKFIETKYFDEEMKPLKVMVRDALIVFMCAGAGSFVYFNLDGNLADFLNVITDTKTLSASATQIFTDEPGF
jgi:hypothetical protein